MTRSALQNQNQTGTLILVSPTWIIVVALASVFSQAVMSPLSIQLWNTTAGSITNSGANVSFFRVTWHHCKSDCVKLLLFSRSENPEAPLNTAAEHKAGVLDYSAVTARVSVCELKVCCGGERWRVFLLRRHSRTKQRRVCAAEHHNVHQVCL